MLKSVPFGAVFSLHFVFGPLSPNFLASENSKGSAFCGANWLPGSLWSPGALGAWGAAGPCGRETSPSEPVVLSAGTVAR